jgi:hypothetical protein
VKSLIWNGPFPPNKECPYNHCFAETLFGRFLLTWKAWKDDPNHGFDETPWGEVEYKGWNSVEEAQAWAAFEMERRCREVLG